MTQVNNNIKGELIKNILRYSILLISEDKTRNKDLILNKVKE